MAERPQARGQWQQSYLLAKHTPWWTVKQATCSCLSELSARERARARDISVNLAVGKRQAKVWRDEIYARLLPIGRILDKLGLTVKDNATKMMCMDGAKQCTLMEFATKNHMRYVSELQFKLLRGVLWAQGLGAVKTFDKTFWQDAMAHGMAKHLTGLNAYPNCQLQSICFGDECEQDEEDWGSSVIFARGVQPDLAAEVETLLANEVVPKGQRWDSVPSILLGARTRQGSGISRYTESKAHLLPTLHRLAANRPGPTQQEYTSIQMHRVSKLQMHTGRFNKDMNWVVSFGQYSGGRVWIEQKNGSSLLASELGGEFHSTHNRWLHFDPRRQHAVEPLVYFTPSRLHGLDQEHWANVKEFGFPCQRLALVHGWSIAVNVCADVWYQDLEDMVPDAREDAGNSAQQDWELHRRQGHISNGLIVPLARRRLAQE
eukprot:3544725-Amphidinium_carterae.2